MDETDVRNGIAEFLGSYALTFAVTGAITAGVVAGFSYVPLLVALSAGLMLAIMVSALGHISGGHFNPAVTFGFLVTGRITARTAVYYWLFQFVGGILAALTVRALYDAKTVAGGTTFDLKAVAAPGLGQSVSTLEAFLAELVMTFVLALVVFATAVDKEGAFRMVAGFAIGLTIAVDILVGGPVSGAYMNPQVALGSAVAAWDWNHGTWIYYIACPIGALIAAVLYDRVFLRPREALPAHPTGENAV
jgi:aquaporin Z